MSDSLAGGEGNPSAIRIYEERDVQRSIKWREKFSHLYS